MPRHHPIQSMSDRQDAKSNTLSSLICLLLLVFSLIGHASPNPPAPINIAQKKNPDTHDFAPDNTEAPTQWVQGRLLVMPRAGLPPQALEKVLKSHGAKSKQHVKELGFHIVELPIGVDEVRVMHALEKNPKLKFVELDMIVPPDFTVNDPSFSSSWALPKIQAPIAWDTASGDNIIIAILDSGIDSDHPDLAANIVPGWNLYDNNADTTDKSGHGTKVAGAAAAAANNGTGSAGVAWMAGIMPIRISDPNGYAYFSTMAQGILWAADNGAKVANISFSGVAASSTVQSAADYLRSKGGVVVVSAGNTGSLLNYAASDSLLVASATDSNDQRTSWSSYGPYVDIAAPGLSIYTTTVGGGYRYVSGTSFSSPIVAATAALMLSANNDLSPVDLDHLLKSTAVDLGSPGFDDYYGAGRVDANAAVTAASAIISQDNQAPTISITAPASGEISGIVPVDVSYSDNVGIVRVELFVNGQKIITDTQSPFAFAWDTTTVTDGDYSLTAQAFDATGNQGASSAVTVTVKNDPSANDTEAPIISITSPTGGEVAGIVAVNVNSSDNVDVIRTELYANSQKIITNNQSPFDFSWDTTAFTDGEYILTAKALDEAGNEGVSTNVSVIVVNTATDDTTAPIITSVNLTDGMTVDNKQTVNISASDNHSVAKIALIIDDIEVATSHSSYLSYNWNTRARGRNQTTQHTVTVHVTDHAGNAVSKTIIVYS